MSRFLFDAWLYSLPIIRDVSFFEEYKEKATLGM